MRSCYSGCRQLLALMTVLIDGFSPYLSGRHQYVRRGSARSTIVYLICGVPQGSVLATDMAIVTIEGEYETARKL